MGSGDLSHCVGCAGADKQIVDSQFDLINSVCLMGLFLRRRMYYVCYQYTFSKWAINGDINPYLRYNHYDFPQDIKLSHRDLSNYNGDMGYHCGSLTS
jgi:hypothetical protein